jgi:hypothetical protein
MQERTLGCIVKATDEKVRGDSKEAEAGRTLKYDMVRKGRKEVS